MAAKGTIGKNNVLNTIQQAFGDDWIGIYDKKGYVWADDNGERIQVAISLTCPKNPIEDAARPVGELNFEDGSAKPTGAQSAVISPQEQESIEQLMKRLGL